jgi:PAS domain S-box-containing protein
MIQTPESGLEADAVRRQNAATELQRTLEDLAEQARALVGAHHAVIRVAADEHWTDMVTILSLSDKYAGWRASAAAAGTGSDVLWCPVPKPMRMTQDELAVHPALRVLRAGTQHRPPLRGWLAVPLFDRQGRNFGAIELSDKHAGEFDADDELRLLQFSQVAASILASARPSKGARPVAPAPEHHPLPAVHSEVGGILLRGGDLHDALQECAVALVRRFDIALMRIWVCQGNILELRASAGLHTHLDGPHSRIPIGQFKVGLVAQTRQPHFADDLVADPHIHDKDWVQREKLQAFAGYPLLDGEEVVGVIAVFDRKPLNPELLQALALLTHPFALFIKRHRIYVPPVARPVRSSIAADPDREHAVIVANLDGTITDWNLGAEQLFGYTRREMIGKGIKMLTPRERASEDRELLRKVADDESTVLPNTQRLRKDGAAVDVCLTASPHHGHAGLPVGAILVAHDIGAMRRLQQQLFIAQKMELFGQLTGGVAHDFNNLLTVILGYSEILLRRYSIDESAQELIGEIRKAGQRAETLTRQLLAFSRKQVVEPQVLDLNLVIGETEKMMRRLIGDDILLTIVLAPALKPVKIDPGQLQQVILNLAVNARDAMPKGGRLTIMTDNVTFDEEYARAHHSRAGAYVLLAMGDTGVGMSPEVQARIFEPLFTTKGPGKGTGLGLATVRSIVKLAGGHIELESEFGRGAAFKIFLPQVQEELSTGKARSGLHAIPRGSETILLAEDDDKVRTLARQVLETCGYHVLEAVNGEEAVRLYEHHEGAIHLLISDVVMPYLGGRAVADHLRTLKPQLKILFLSGYTADDAAKHGVTEADFALLQKPFSIRALAQKVRDVLDGAPR